MTHSSGKQARAIEQIVRALLLALVPTLLVVEAMLLKRGWVAGAAGAAVVAPCLVGAVRLLAKAPARELLALCQRGVVAAAVLVLLALGLGPRLGLYRTMTVLSGSMRPTFNPGDMIVVSPEPLRDVRAGQVIAFSVPVAGGPVATHRVIRILKGGAEPVVQTKGDANSWRDPWTAQLHGTTAWRLTAVIPCGGFAINFLRNPLVHRVAIFGAPSLLALLLLAEIWGVSLPKPKKKAEALTEVPAR